MLVKKAITEVGEAQGGSEIRGRDVPSQLGFLLVKGKLRSVKNGAANNRRVGGERVGQSSDSKTTSSLAEGGERIKFATVGGNH